MIIKAVRPGAGFCPEDCQCNDVALSVSCENAGRSSQANQTKPFYSKYLSLALCVMRECREVVSGYQTKPFYTKDLSLALRVMRECREVVAGY